MDTRITIKSLNAKPEIDPYHADTGQITQTVINIYPDTVTVVVDQDYDDGATPGELWLDHYCQLRTTAHPIEKDMYDWLEAHEADIITVCDGHSIEWDGSNMRGHLTDDARNALEHMQDTIEDLGNSTQYVLYTPDEWLSDADGLGDLAQITDADLHTLAHGLTPAGLQDDYVAVIDESDIYDYLCDLRTEQRAELEDA